MDDFQSNPTYLQAFTRLDDYDIWACIKAWATHPDPVLSTLCRMLLNRDLFKIMLSTEPFQPMLVDELAGQLRDKGLSDDELSYFLVEGQASNAAYLPSADSIRIKSKNGYVRDISEASDLTNIGALSTIVRRHYVCWARELAWTVTV